ncbi:ATP-binding cassette domain-containing protein [Fructilactobacillus florum]|nr:ATP-binding cassette domain-containing protein [Fructilactobacillus florum]
MPGKIEFNDVAFSYDGADPVFEQLSFTLQSGQTTALVGPNGSGKSTIIKLLDGLLLPTAGTIKLDDEPLRQENRQRLQQKLALVFQTPADQLIAGTVAENVAFGLENRQVDYETMHQLVPQAMKQVGISELAEHDPSWLSGGQQQKVALASALAVQPEILVLDEATSMLDAATKEAITTVLTQLQKTTQLTILMITHDVSAVAQADQVLALNQHKVVFQGAPARFFEQPDLLTAMQMQAPFSAQVQHQLCDRGITVPAHYLDDEGLSQWISQLF